MEQTYIDEIIGCLPKGRTLFPYFKDRYALVLLSYFVDRGKPMHAIKQSRFRGLLDKPLLKNTTQTLPGVRLTRDVLASVWPEAHEVYRLTLGTWGSPSKSNWNQGWYQTSRPGKNLVLQLNFSSKHNRPYYRLIKPNPVHPFQWGCHPTSRQALTLAWTRLDVDLDAGVALIEEIQNDWIREALWCKRILERCSGVNEHLRQRILYRYFGMEDADLGRLQHYLNRVLEPHVGLWDEAMLTATLWFLRQELGIHRIFFHTFDSGIRLKGMRKDRPPRSLYTRLPRRFCFQETDEVPAFLMTHRRVRKEVRKGGIRFYLLDLQN